MFLYDIIIFYLNNVIINIYLHIIPVKKENYTRCIIFTQNDMEKFRNCIGELTIR